LPVSDARIYPVSGGSEAIETAVKLARTYHLARGEGHRTIVLGRWGSYHGNTLGALDVSGRPPLRDPYLPWLGRFDHQPPVYEYRCPSPHHPVECGRWHAKRLEERIIDGGDVAAFLAEPISGASLGAAVPPDDYWPAVADVCRRNGVLLIADEVMTGFGRTGAWFASDHWNLGPDILVAGKGVSSGYWPLGLCVASGAVWQTVKEGGFPHGFTNSHHPIGAAVGREVLRILSEEGLIEAAALQGARLASALHSALDDHPAVGDIRGKGLLLGVELVADRASKRPHPRSERMVEGLRDACMREGLVVYPSTGCADGVDGDLFLLGPPLIVSDAEIDQLVERLSRGLATIRSLS
jgi:adenosylmethionine-8-amino-7-oxononanoate aminotransferase